MGLGRVRILPGRLCVRFLGGGEQGGQEENQHNHGEEPDGLAQTTEAPQVRPHGGGPGPRETAAGPVAWTWDSSKMDSWDILGGEYTHPLSS